MANKFYNIKTGKFNLSAIMTAAWAEMTRSSIHKRLSMRLGVIWAEAKAEKANSQRTAPQQEAFALRNEATLIQMKTRMSVADFTRVDELNSRANALAA